tara:strand:+ start:938 stop:1348 length:411 start_codon:yes stop_codon:yes gene_type:complete
MAGSCFEPAVEPGAHHLNLQWKRFTRQPDTPLEANHLLFPHEVGQQLLEGLAVDCPLQANVAANHLDMAVIVMIVVVVIVVVVALVVVVVVAVVVMRGLMLQAQHNRCLHLSLRDRQQSGARADFVLNSSLNISHR